MASMAKRDRSRRMRFPLRFGDGTQATVCELSAGGMYVETPAVLSLGQLLVFELRPPGSHLVFTASGEVVELHAQGRRRGARVRFTDLRMHTAR